MSISSTVKKFMPYIKTAKDYVLLRLSSQAVEMDDGTTLEAKVTSLNSLISKKLNSANVVNNLTTTNAGYALDARQGKSLSDKITQLNSALSKLIVTELVNVTFKYNNEDNLNRFEIVFALEGNRMVLLWWNETNIAYDYFDGTEWYSIWKK